MMKQILLSFLTSLLVVTVVLFLWKTPTASTAETAYARVMRTNTLRCGWYVMPPYFQRDPNTGSFSGVYFDLMEEIGKQLNLKIEWTEEVSGATAFEGLKTGRYDAVCAAFAPLPGRAKVAEFTNAFSYRPVFAYARSDNSRFDNHPERIDSPNVKISVIEGQGAHLFATRLFPHANLLVLPSFSDLTQNELNVSTGKADLSLAESSTAERFIKNNPGKIKAVAGPPLIVVANTLQVGAGEEALKSMLNTTLDYLTDLRFIAKTHEKFLGKEGLLYTLPVSKSR